MDERLQDALQENMFKLMFKGLVKTCFEKCVSRPGKELSSKEKQCLAMCQDRYMEAFQKTYSLQFQKLAQNMQSMKNESDFPLN